MSRPIAWIRRQPVIAFYVLCYALSGGLWLPYMLFRNGLLSILASIGLFGPALVCILVARITSPAIEAGRRKVMWLAFLLAWAACAAIAIVYAVETSWTVPLPALVVLALNAAVPAYVIASAFSGVSGVRKTLSTLIRPRGWWGWYALALLLPPLLRLFAVWVSRQLGWPLLSYPKPAAGLLELAGSVLIIFAYTFIYAGGLNEETGWTGFALPRLQARYSPFVASLVVWFFWILWHVPLHQAGLYEISLHVLVGTFSARFIFTWLYNRSRGGLLTAILFHTSANVASQFISLTNASLLVEGLLALALILGARMWRRLPADDPAAFTAETVSG